MNLILLFEDDFVSLDEISASSNPRYGKVRLRGRRLDYVQTIHRAQRGDELCVGLLGGWPPGASCSGTSCRSELPRALPSRCRVFSNLHWYPLFR